MNPKVSVIVPVYKAEKYIERCATSLFGQTLDEIEYIFIDDNSPDNSIQILETLIPRYEKRISQIRIERMPANVGQAKIRQYGTHIATGDYIIHCDSDDWVDCHMYEDLYNYAEINSMDMVWCDFYKSDGRKHKLITQSNDVEKISVINSFFTGKLMASLCNRMYKRNLHLSKDFVFPSCNMTEDFVFSLQIALNSNKIGYIPKPYYYYYINNSSISRSVSAEQILCKLDDVQRNSEIIFSIIKRNHLLHNFEKAIEYRKLLCRGVLNPVLNQNKMKDKWLNVYPEINDVILCNPYITNIQKLQFYLIKNRYNCLYNLLFYVESMLRRFAK